VAEARLKVTEIVMAVVLIAVAGAFLREGWNYAPGVFEPIGSGTVPNGVAWIVVALSGAMLIRAVVGRSGNEHPEPERWRTAGLAAVLVVLYVVALSVGIRYQWATLAFALVTILVLSPAPRRTLPGAALSAAVLGFGLDYLFRDILVTDLP
jgi:hypothetical protein